MLLFPAPVSSLAQTDEVVDDGLKRGEK